MNAETCFTIYILNKTKILRGYKKFLINCKENIEYKQKNPKLTKSINL